MKILGFNISRSNKHAENTSVVKVVESTAAKPSIELKKSYPRSELGDSGTRILKGIVVEEYNPNLQGRAGIRVYDEMRKSDGTVRAAVMATTLPIRSAEWFISPASEDQKDKDIAKFVEHALFECLSWEDILRQALLMVPFGVMVFEKVYGIKKMDGKDFIVLEKLAPRMPKSIQQWELTDGTFGIQQVRQDGFLAQIPGSKLLIFVNEKEGDNWEGTSMLRGAYKHWYFKNTFYKIDAIAFERQGLGVPKITMPKSYTEDDEKKAAQAASNLRSSESAYLLLPDGYTAEFMNMGANSTRDPKNSIDHHNKEILVSVLAQFLELGQASTGGSKALSEDHSDIFLNAMNALAKTIQTEINKNLIKELVDFNFSDVEIYPKIDFTGIDRTDVTGLSTAYNNLVTSKGIKPSQKDEQYFRALLGLPQLSQEDMDERKDEEEDGKDNTDINNKGDMNGNMQDDDMGDDSGDDMMDNKKKDNTQKAHEHIKRIRKYDDGNGFMTWRKMTFAEKKVNLPNIEDRMNKLQESFTSDATELLLNAKDSFVTKLQKALDNDEDTKAIADLEIKFVKDYKSLMKEYMKQGYEYGKTMASGEMKKETPANSSSTLRTIDLLADTVAWKAATDIETKAKTGIVNGLKKLSDKKSKEKYTSIIQVVGSIDQTLEDVIDKTVSASSGLIINQSINFGRNDVFEKYMDDIYALQRSEILDNDTCDFCLSMDGRIVKVDDEWAKEDTFHTNCRGIWVEILNDEVNKPEIDGVPDNLGDYYGGEPNALIQPPKPIITEDSPAKEEVDRRAEEKKKKKKTV